MVFNYFKKMTKFLIIEFIPPEDSWVNELLDRKRAFKPLFDFYNQEAFETTCSDYFIVLNKITIPGSLRILYLLKAK